MTMKSTHWLCSAALLCAIALAAEATQAAEVAYEFYGYIRSRSALTPQLLPREFTLGAPISGLMTFDPEHRGIDIDGNEVIRPVLMLRIRAAAGGLIAEPASDSSLSLSRDPQNFVVEASAASSGASPTALVRFRWSGPVAGQLPQDITTVDPAALQPNSWDLTLTAQSCDGCSGEPVDVAEVHIVMLTRYGSAFDTLDNFALPPTGWVNSGGAWFWRDGYWTNEANTAFTSTTYSGRELKRDFSVSAELFPEWRASGNTFGLVFNYLNSNNFYEIRLNALGTLMLNKVVNGTRTMIQSARYEVPQFRVPLIVVMLKSGSDIDVRVHSIGAPAEFQIHAQDASLSRGRAGAFASWNKVRVDEFSIRQTQFWGTTVSRFDTAAGWTPAAGSWLADAGVYRNTSNQLAAISLAESPIFARRYAIHTDMNFQWSGSGNRGGVVYDYVDANNYRAALMRAVKVVNGIPQGGGIELIEVRNGVRTSVPVVQPAVPVFIAGQWARLSVIRFGDVTSVRATCRDPPPLATCGEFHADLTQTELVGRKRAGLLASWNLVRFDDAVVATEN
jgi:hypothetical protein